MYTIEEFIKDCTELKNDDAVSFAVDNTHILVGIGYEDCINIELNLGYVTDEGNVCEELIANCCINHDEKHQTLSAVEYLIDCI